MVLFDGPSTTMYNPSSMQRRSRRAPNWSQRGISLPKSGKSTVYSDFHVNQTQDCQSMRSNETSIIHHHGGDRSRPWEVAIAPDDSISR